MNGHRSAANLLALVYAALVVYASLYPFEGWRWPAGAAALDLLVLPRAVSGDDFDVGSNLLGYVPFGLLLTIGRLRSGVRPLVAVLLAVTLPALLSYTLEATQGLLPTRYPSLKDWALNLSGAAIGALLALGMHQLGLVDRWHALRERWFERHSGAALTLLALWPVGLLFPAPAPLGLGQIGGGRLLDAFLAWSHGMPWEEGLLEVLQPAAANASAVAAAADAVAGTASAAATAASAAFAPPAVVVSSALATGLAPLAEILIIALGLLAPCVVAFAVVAPGWRRLALAFGALLMAAGGMTLATWLNFGPQHALAWVTPWAGPAVGLATLVVLLMAPLPRAVVQGLGLMVLTGLVVAVAQAPADPYFAHNLQGWEHGRFVRFHGLAQWVGWLWPYAAIAWLLSRMGIRR